MELGNINQRGRRRFIVIIYCGNCNGGEWGNSA
jgi:hypothetical protein